MVDPIAFTDASFGILPERRSVKAHILKTCKESGCVMASCKAIKNTVENVFEAELMALNEGINDMKFVHNVVDELDYPQVMQSRKIMNDTESGATWIKGGPTGVKSRHAEVRMWKARHEVRDGNVSMEQVPTVDNEADLISKIATRAVYDRLAPKILGHSLGKHLPIRGVMKIEEEDKM